ncbi:hypothetical protein O0L47_02825 [Staphylococcus pseudintermedius]|nr:hypothetical protein [Staphylococcus pseudintermedius]MDF0247262.1 hypothetical protein [Staphylococcus pseudintermedius]MDF0258596.1 hypothetical protein [Staphylococcus pseudintermedius]MDF0260831.1 hypothetical protein [Staphylococcus pseudintermedius]MDF0263133.1 hypothetical protein [Staphylococcus pseudintermedius]
MEGAQFWRAYLFEFPFAVMRFLGYYLYFILLIPLFVVYHQFKKKLKELIV